MQSKMSTLHHSEAGLEVLYGVTFPAFKFPEGSVSSYFFQQLAGDLLTESVTFPEGGGNDFYKLNLGLENEICLSTLIANMVESESAQSDTNVAARKVSALIKMLGIQGCFNIEVKGVSNIEGYEGIKLGLTSQFIVFDSAVVDWSILFDSIENSIFRNFLLLSGSATKDMADSVFEKLLSLIGISEIVEYTFDVGAALIRMLNELISGGETTDTDINFVDPVDGSILLGSYAIGSEPQEPPTSLPSYGMPSGKPTSWPTRSGKPTSSPTTATATSLSFNTQVKVNGVDAATFLSDESYTDAYVAAMAAMSNISAAGITVTSVTDLDSRPFLLASISRTFSGPSLIVQTNIKVIIEEFGVDKSDWASLYDKLKTVVTQGTSSGSFGTKLAAEAAKRALPAPISIDDTFAVVTDEAVILEERTPAPSASPTLAPDEDGHESSTFGLSYDALIGVVVVTVVVGLVCICVLGLLLRRTCAAVVAAEESIVVERTRNTRDFIPFDNSGGGIVGGKNQVVATL